MIPREFIDDLLGRVNIIDVISKLVPTLKKVGKNHVARCPFHQEKSPSFTVSEQNQFYKCFGCGESGNAIKFVMEYEQLEFPESIKYLADMMGVQVPNDGAYQEKNSHAGTYQLLKKAAAFYSQYAATNETYSEFREQRSFSEETFNTFDVGLAPNAWRNFFDSLTPEETDSAIEADLVKSKDNKTYDTFRNRITFPIKDHKGRVVGFSARTIDGTAPKYLNTTDTPVFNKSDLLYGLHETLTANRRPPRIIVVEGQLDVQRHFECNMPYSVAPLGTALNHKQIQTLQRKTEKIIYCFDGDRAGIKAALRTLHEIAKVLNDSTEHRFVLMPNGMDPDDYLLKYGAEQYALTIRNALQITDFCIAIINELFDTSTDIGYMKAVSEARKIIECFEPTALSGAVNRALCALLDCDIKSHSSTPTKSRAKPKIMDSHLTDTRVFLSCCVCNPRLIQQYQPIMNALKNSRIEMQPLINTLLALSPDINHIDAHINTIKDSRVAKQINFLRSLPSLEHFPSGNVDSIAQESAGSVTQLLLKERAKALTEQSKERALTEDEKYELSLIFSNS